MNKAFAGLMFKTRRFLPFINWDATQFLLTVPLNTGDPFGHNHFSRHMTIDSFKPAAYALICFFGLASIDRAVPAEAPMATAVESEKLIRSQFDRTDLHLRIQQGPASIELCADVCDFFTWSKPQIESEIWDFVVLYEYQRGIGTLEGVAERYKATTQTAVPLLLWRYESYCPARADEEALVSCVLVRLAERNNLRIGLVEYDNGDRCLAWADVKDPARLPEYRCTRTGKKAQAARKSAS